ncbi:MAG TPA: SBBP repeat-containing protein [Bryobacteraceae bacterium]|nr:SBBP repeat-containing protein [Bryobacteraceae bacterium]
MRFVLFFITALAIAGDFTTSLGDAYPYMISAITTDSAGNTYVVGSRALGGIYFAVINPFGGTGGITVFPSVTLSGGSDVFVSKLDPSGQVLFTDTFAGKGVDQGIAIALDLSGNIYIAGTTTSNDFPLSKALQTQSNSSGTGFVMKLSNDGSTILYSTYFGGVLGMTSVNAMTTDAAGNLYLTGTTFASDFPHTAGMPSATIQNGQSYAQPPFAAFVVALDPAGDKILFAGAVGGTQTRCGGGINDCERVAASTTGIAIALDSSRNVYFGGNTNTVDLPTTSGAFLKQGMGAFAGKIASGGTGLAYLTYLGSAEELAQGPLLSGTNLLSSLTADSAGNAYLAGNTGDPKFPATAGAYQTVFAGGPLDGFGIPANTDGFVAKLKPDGSGLVWATYLGGSGNDAVGAIAVDAAGNVWATGTTSSPTFPNTKGWSQGGDFLVEFNPSGSAISYSARYPTGTIDQAIALDPSGLVHLAGPNGLLSTVVPTGAPVTGVIFAFQNAFGGGTAGRISPAEVISIYGPSIGPATAASAAPVNGFYPTIFSGVQVQINGVNAPLLYVSANQINAVVPMDLITGAGATVRVINGNAISPSYPVWVVPSAAQAFPTALNQDGTLNSETPAKSNSVVTVYATGWQWNFSSPLADGQVATMAQDFCSGQCTASANGFPGMTILYGGTAPGIVAGVTQFNIKLGTIITSLGAATISLTGPGGAINVTVLVAGSLP